MMNTIDEKRQFNELLDLLARDDPKAIKDVAEKLREKAEEIVAFAFTSQGLDRDALGGFVGQKIEDAVCDVSKLIGIKK